MSQAANLVGNRFATSSFALDAARGLAYAAATDDDETRYQRTGLAPPMAVVMASIPLGVTPVVCDAEVIGDASRLMRLLHAEEDIQWLVPLRLGETFEVRPTLAACTEKGSGETLVVLTELFDSAGRHVASATSSMLIRNKGGAARRDDGARRAPAPAQPKLEPQFRDTWTVAADQAARYAQASGDINPIHLDDAVARMAGLPGCVLQGLCTMAFAQRAVLQHCADGDPARLRRLRARFTRPVFMGDTLTFAARKATADHDHDRPTYEFTVENAAGQSVLSSGVAELG